MICRPAHDINSEEALFVRPSSILVEIEALVRDLTENSSRSLSFLEKAQSFQATTSLIVDITTSAGRKAPWKPVHVRILYSGVSLTNRMPRLGRG